MLCIPLRHVHPLGKCNRAMAAALSKHKANADDDEEIEEDDIDFNSIADTTPDNED